MHDAVPDRLDPFHAADRPGKLRFIEPPFGDLKLAVGDDAVVLVDKAQLE
jgi:hypothetical protein